MFACLLLLMPAPSRPPPPEPRAACVCQFPELDPRPADYLWRFPEEELARQYLDLAQRRLDWLRSQRGLFPQHPVWAAAIADEDLRREAWESLVAAQHGYRWGGQAMIHTAGPAPNLCLDPGAALAHLRGLIGPQAFELGVMPLP